MEKVLHSLRGELKNVELEQQLQQYYNNYKFTNVCKVHAHHEKVAHA